MLHAVTVSRLIVGGVFVDRRHARRVVQFRPLDLGVRRFWIAEPSRNSGSIVTVISTPFAVVPSYRPFRVVGIFESGFYDFDAKWAYTSLAAAQQAMSLGDVQAFIQYSRQFTQPLTQVASMANLLQSGVASAERVFDLLDTPEQSPDSASGESRCTKAI